MGITRLLKKKTLKKAFFQLYTKTHCQRERVARRRRRKKNKNVSFSVKKKNEDRAEKERKQEKKKDRKYSISLALSQLAPSPLNSRYLFLTEKIKRVSQEKKEIYNLKNSFIFFRAAPS